MTTVINASAFARNRARFSSPRPNLMHQPTNTTNNNNNNSSTKPPPPPPPLKNIQYVLLAEFDIDKGSTVRHQYPQQCPVSENILADLMLPEGAHLRDSDWTYFFLRDGEHAHNGKERKRRMTKVDKWAVHRRELIDNINNESFVVQVLEFSESVSDWFIMHDDAKCKFVYTGKWDAVEDTLPNIMMKISNTGNTGGAAQTADPDTDPQTADSANAPANTGTGTGTSTGTAAAAAANTTTTMPEVLYSAPVDIDLQFTVLSEKELFCSFYPPQGNAIGLKFVSVPDLRLVSEIIQQVTEPTKKPVITAQEREEAEARRRRLQEEHDANASAKHKKKATLPLVVLNLVRTQKNKSVKRGAVVKAIAIATHLRILETFKPLLMLALDDYYRTESEDGLINLYTTINDISFDVGADGNHNHNHNDRGQSPDVGFFPKNPSYYDNIIMRTGSGTEDTGDGHGTGTEDTGAADSKTTIPIKFHGIHIPLTVALRMGPDEISGVSVMRLFRKFHKHISIVFNAVFTARRLIFVGHNEPSHAVSNMVLAACLLVSPAIEGLLFTRAYPYACLTAMQFLQVPGYIAGVTNPIFEQREEWWDVLCNITTGDVKVSEGYRLELEAEQPTHARTLTSDKQLVAEIRNGLQLQQNEKWLRSVFSDTAEHVVKMALNLEVFESEAQQRAEFEVNEWRIETWKKTDSFQEQIAILEQYEMASPFREKTRSFDRIVRTIQIKALDEGLARRYFAKIDHELSSEAKIAYFVKLLKPSMGGLYPIMQYLFHKDLFISNKLLDIGLKLEASKAAKKLMGSLNFFYIVTFERLKEERNAGLRKKAVKLKKKLPTKDVYTGRIGGGGGGGRGRGHIGGSNSVIINTQLHAIHDNMNNNNNNNHKSHNNQSKHSNNHNGLGHNNGYHHNSHSTRHNNNKNSNTRKRPATISSHHHQPQPLQLANNNHNNKNNVNENAGWVSSSYGRGNKLYSAV